MNCNSKNVIYVLVCKKCKKEYIGQTKNFRSRMTVHRQQIREKNIMTGATKHFIACNNIEYPFIAFPFYKTSEDLLEQKEKLFIDTFKPELNNL